MNSTIQIVGRVAKAQCDIGQKKKDVECLVIYRPGFGTQLVHITEFHKFIRIALPELDDEQLKSLLSSQSDANFSTTSVSSGRSVCISKGTSEGISKRTGRSISDATNT